jgi:PAS domain S-box-containing protein
METKSQEELLREIDELQEQLSEARETLHAIRNGRVDAFVVSDAEGEHVYTLKSADYTYRVLVESMNEGALKLAQDGTIFYCNRRFAEMLKTPSEKVIGSSILEYVEPVEQDRIKGLLRPAENANLKTERHFNAADGTKIPVMLAVSSLPIDDAPGFCVVATDLTERRLAEEKISRANAMLQAVFDGISDPLLMIDKSLSVRMLNDAACQYFHIANQEEAIGKTCYQLAFGKGVPCDHCAATSAILEGRRMIFERKGLFDSEHIEEITIYPVDEAVGGVSGAIVRINDITENRNMEEHLTRADRLASLGQLSGGIAHEIRNPLQGINLFVDVFSDEEKFRRTSEELHILGEIKSNIKRIDDIIKRVLDLSRQREANALCNMNLGVLIEDSLQLWQLRLVKDRIQLNLFLEENLPEVPCDAVEIQQVLTNLIRNAVEALGKQGTLSISARRGTLSFDKKRPAVIIEVEDSGPGIPVDLQKNIFNPFFTTKHTGTGLGLAISHRIISRHGGLISFESMPKQGTTFTLELPAAPGS